MFYLTHYGTIIGHIRDGFYGSNDQTNSVKALKKDRVLRIRIQSHQVHSTSSCYNNITHMQYDKKHKHESRYSTMGPAQ